MASPFPGMDPYLEKRNRWRSFHQSFAVEIMGQLNSRLGPRYFADVEVHTVLDEIDISAIEGYPDVAVLDIDPVTIVHPPLPAAPTAPLVRPALAPNLTKLRTVLVF